MRFNPKSLFLLCVGLYVCLLSSYGQSSPAHSLLWRISGNGTTRPSYLFGTIHLQNQEVFNFSDSVYKALENADGYAMELHPDSIVAGMIRKIAGDGKKVMVKDKMKKKEYEAFRRKLKEKMGLDADNMSLQEAYMLKQRTLLPSADTGDMSTFVDAYLYGLANQQGKQIVGLERVEDQMNLSDDLGTAFDARRLVTDNGEDKKMARRMINLYINEDLDSLMKAIAYIPDSIENKILMFRNRNMSRTMDSLIRAHSFFVAVGAAHLAGREGLIELLRARGYMVTPVITTTRTHANHYKLQHRANWVQVNDTAAGYSVSMPGQPSSVPLSQEALKLKMYMDLTSMRGYFSGFVTPGMPVTSANEDSVLKAMVHNMIEKTNATLLSQKITTEQGFRKVEAYYQENIQEMYVRFQAFGHGRRIYMVYLLGRTREELENEDARQFFNSFIIRDMPGTRWQLYTNDQPGFRVLMPGKPKMDILNKTDSTVAVVRYGAVDTNNGGYYAVIWTHVNPGYELQDDSTYAEGLLQTLRNNVGLEISTVKDTTFAGYPARIVHGWQPKTKLDMIGCRVKMGNQSFTFYGTAENDSLDWTGWNRLINSFVLVPRPQPVQWKLDSSTKAGFTTWAPDTFHFAPIQQHADSTITLNLIAFDKNTYTNFFVQRRRFSPYTWSRDTAILQSWLSTLAADGKVLVSKFVRQGTEDVLDVTLAYSNTSMQKRCRVLVNGDRFYILQVSYLPGQDTADMARFFTDFRLHDDGGRSFIFSNGPDKWLHDLASTDSTLRDSARRAIKEISLTHDDLPMLLQLLVDNYTGDRDSDYEWSFQLKKEIARLLCETDLHVVERYYRQTTAGNEKAKYPLLGLAAGLHTREAYHFAARMLQGKPPTAGDADVLVSQLRDSLALAHEIYPSLMQHAADSLLGTSLFSLHNALLEDSVITIDSLRPYLSQLLESAKYQLAAMKRPGKDNYFNNYNHYTIGVLKRFNTAAVNQVLTGFTVVKPVFVRKQAAIALLENHEPVAAAVWESIARERETRSYLYYQLKQLKKTGLFPARYKTQAAFAESYFDGDMDDIDMTVDSLKKAGERVVTYHGKKYRFFLYKVRFDEQDGYYLGISRPFTLNAVHFEADDDADVSGYYSDEPFDAARVDEQLKAYLESLERQKEDSDDE